MGISSLFQIILNHILLHKAGTTFCKISAFISSTPGAYWCMLIGDFNAKVGKEINNH
jgi:hypothetical protein